jgi:hypothetical protein
MKTKKEIVNNLMIITIFFGGFFTYDSPFQYFQFKEYNNIQSYNTEITEEETETVIENINMEIQNLEKVMEPFGPLRETEVSTSASQEEESTTIEETEKIFIIEEKNLERETEILLEEETIEQIENSFVPVNSMMNEELQEWVYDYCMEQEVDPYIIMAVCERESCCTANIMGDNGKAYGIMQIQVRWVQDKLAAHGYTNETMLYAQPNIVIGTEILKDYLDMGYGYEWALMAYNGGIQLVDTDMTREYATWVLARADELRNENT